jgi:hypothetical protein
MQQAAMMVLLLLLALPNNSHMWYMEVQVFAGGDGA